MLSRRLLPVLAVLCILSLPSVRAEQAPQPPQPRPVSIVGPQSIADWTPYLNDIVGGDAAKQGAAAKVFIDAGSRGHAALASLLKHADPKVVKRATEIRQQIDQRSIKMYQETAQANTKMMSEPLTVAAMEAMRQKYLALASYASQPTLKQYGYQAAAELQKGIKGVDEAIKQLAAQDEQLKAAPEPKGLARATIQLERAGSLRTLKRHADMLAAAEDAAACSGKEGRLTPSALKLQLEAYQSLENNAKIEETARKILAEYPRSLESKQAHRSLLQLLSDGERWDDAAKEARAFLAAYPVDEETQEAVYGLLETLMTEAREYKRVTPLAEWLMETLPPERLKPELPKYCGGCNEYIVHDYAKAQAAYTLLRDRFADIVSADDMNAAINRLKQKAEGKFPPGPAEDAAGVAGVFARFLKAARGKDTKTLAGLVPKEAAEEFVDRLGDSSEELLPIVVFADFVLKAANVDDAAGKGKLLLDYYDASNAKPKLLTLDVVKEDGQWKICWEDPQEEMELPKDGAPAIPKAEPKKEALRE